VVALPDLGLADAATRQRHDPMLTGLSLSDGRLGKDYKSIHTWLVDACDRLLKLREGG